MSQPDSELLWKLADYRRAKQEPPAILHGHPELCEGDLMTAEEVASFIKDSIATLRILADKASTRYKAVLASYCADMAALLELGRIDQDEYNELTDEQTLHF